MKVYILQHLMIYSHDDEDVKLIGAFATINSAIDAVNELSNKPGFKLASRIIDPLEEDYVSGFYIDEYTINELSWGEGFCAGDLNNLRH